MAEQTHTVRFEPVGIEMEVTEGETVLDAAFRQGISLMHGCKEGQCSSCKSRLVEGDIELLKYSTFALPDYERDTDHILLCRTLAYSDITVELLNYDEDLLSRSIAVKSFAATLVSITNLTHDIRLLEVELDAPLRFWAGQYVDLTIPEAGITRAFSMANPPSEQRRLRFIIKKYPDGAFSSQLDGGLQPGAKLIAKGPYGTCFRREARPGPLVLIGGGSGMSPLWSILHDHLESGEQRPVRFFYGARNLRDLFYLDRLAELAARHDNFRFIPALSHATPDEGWEGETGFVHEVVKRTLQAEALQGEIDAYSCGPPPMIDAVLPILQMAGVEPERIYFDKFTPAAH
jgi:propane monooxygenase reductase component